MRYRLNLPSYTGTSLSLPPASGALISPAAVPVGEFVAWQPSTWPATPASVDQNFIYTLKKIFEESILVEIQNVIVDAGGDLQHRGHVVAIALLCALDAISSYGYGRKNGRQIPAFVQVHFPDDYQSYAHDLRQLYRNAMIHSWNLFQVAILPGYQKIGAKNGILEFGLLEFFDVLVNATQSFLAYLDTDAALQKNTLKRYKELRGSARP